MKNLFWQAPALLRQAFVVRRCFFLLAAFSLVQPAWSQWTTAGTNIYNSNTGNVGIGTTTPAVMLDVRGQVNAYSFGLMNPGNSNDNVLRSTFGTNNFDLIGTYSGWDPNGVFVAGYNSASGPPIVNATQRVYIGSPYSGTNNFLCVNFMTSNVGIGTSNPGSNKLAVEGTIGARKVVVTLASPFPDYVFYPGYRLLSTDSLRRYIEAYHHLPDIPSADSVGKNGLDLGNNQAVLLKKIEELTLYIIQQDKRIRQLEEANAGISRATRGKKGRGKGK